MAVSNRHILYQGPVILGLAKTAAGAVRQRVMSAARARLPAPIAPAPPAAPATPGPLLRRTVKPLPRALIDDYLRHVGAKPGRYPGQVPAHLFPQWSLALSTATIAKIPYPLMRVVNGGCRLEINAPLAADEPFEVSAQLLSVDDNGRRAVMHQRIITSTRAHPEAVVGHFFAIVPLKKRAGKSGGSESGVIKDERAKKKEKKEKARGHLVPEDARELERWDLDERAGLDFARLTGDFNPIHWVAPHARAFGFKNVILHGFSTQARAFEGLARHLAPTGQEISALDVQFTRPLTLPARVGLFIDRDPAARTIYVAARPGDPAYLVGTFETRKS